MINYRDFRRDDLTQVIDLLQDVSEYRPTIDEFPKILMHCMEAVDSKFVVAESPLSHLIVGFASIFYYTRIRGGQVGVIEDVVVSADYRGQSLGSTLISKLESDAKSRGVHKLTLTSAPDSENFYFHLGFKASGLMFYKAL